MKKVKEITKTSVLNTIDYLMAGAGITREQALVAMETVIHYVRAHPGEKINQVIVQLLNRRSDERQLMN